MPTDFGAELRSHRRAAHLTQEQLAARAGLSPRAIRYLESGRIRRPRPTSAAMIATALGLTGQPRTDFLHAAHASPPASPTNSC